MLELRVVTAEATAGLRREVLRGGRPLPSDPLAASAFHVGVYDGPELLATGNVRREPAPWAPGEPAWRIRGMATSDGHRGEGLGAQVLSALLAHCAESGGGQVWCTARTPARSFYERAGFEAVGEIWEEPEIGPHVRMRRTVAPEENTP